MTIQVYGNTSKHGDYYLEIHQNYNSIKVEDLEDAVLIVKQLEEFIRFKENS